MILVFKTNINNYRQTKSITKVLNGNSKIEFWNFDLEDIDKILRIVTQFEIQNEIIEMMRKHNLHCEELF